MSVCWSSVRFAAEQRWSVACGETAGNSDLGTKKLRSSDVGFLFGQKDVAAPQLHNHDRRIPKGSRPGLPPSAAPQPIASPARSTDN
jgi:hypothetical protein